MIEAYTPYIHSNTASLARLRENRPIEKPDGNSFSRQKATYKNQAIQNTVKKAAH